MTGWLIIFFSYSYAACYEMLVSCIPHTVFYMLQNMIWYPDLHSLSKQLHNFFTTRQPWWTNASSLSRLHFHTELDTPHSAGLLWTSNRPVADISNWQNTTLTWERHQCRGGIRTRNSSKRSAAHPRPRLHGHRNWRYIKLLIKNSFPHLYST